MLVVSVYGISEDQVLAQVCRFFKNIAVHLECQIVAVIQSHLFFMYSSRKKGFAKYHKCMGCPKKNILSTTVDIDHGIVVKVQMISTGFLFFTQDVVYVCAPTSPYVTLHYITLG